MENVQTVLAIVTAMGGGVAFGWALGKRDRSVVTAGVTAGGGKGILAPPPVTAKTKRRNLPVPPNAGDWLVVASRLLIAVGFVVGATNVWAELLDRDDAAKIGSVHLTAVAVTGVVIQIIWYAPSASSTRRPFQGPKSQLLLEKSHLS